MSDFPEPTPLNGHGPARIIAMCNQKGGVGKTTTTISLAGALAEFGRKVLVVDFDPQGGLTAGLGMMNHEGDTIYELMMGKVKDVRQVIKPTKVDGIHIIPANIHLAAAEVRLVSEVARESILASVLRPIVAEYDVIFIDCQPSLGLLTVNALTAAHGVLIPLACEYFALRGVALLLETIEMVTQRTNPIIQIDGIIPTMYDPRTLHSKEILEKLHADLGDQLLSTLIHRTVKFPDSTIAGSPITSFAPEHPAANAYRELAKELIARGKIA